MPILKSRRLLWEYGYSDLLLIIRQSKKGLIEVAVKVIVAALTAFLTAITTTSCMGYGPF